MSSSDESFELSSSTVSSSTSCTESDDILSTIPQLSDELEYFGLQPLPQVPSDEGKILMKTKVASLVSSLIEAIWNLIQLHQSKVRQHDEAEDTRHRLADDNKNLKAQVDNLKKDLSNKERQLFAAIENEQKLNAGNEKLQHELKKEKEEVRRLLSLVNQRDSQHAHELRKKEHEVLHVQEQLRHNIGLPRSVLRQGHGQNQHETNRKSTVDSSNSGDTARLQDISKMPDEQEEIYRKIIYKYEHNNQILIQENTSLRNVYSSLHTNLGLIAQQFADILNKHMKADENGHEEEVKKELKILTSSMFQMPFDEVKDYNKELHEESDKYLQTLQLVLGKLTESFQVKHSS